MDKMPGWIHAFTTATHHNFITLTTLEIRIRAEQAIITYNRLLNFLRFFPTTGLAIANPVCGGSLKINSNSIGVSQAATTMSLPTVLQTKRL
ncbi:hypothetical protein [Aeromonas jandaei]|uniref:hypothetical protein n=1 Tax=Aeromonas jandaei TaxID=650 RepID=UPI003BA3957D